MAVPFTQLVASTYDGVIKDRDNKAADNWSDSAFLKYLEKIGAIKRMAGATLQMTLDYQQNPGADFLATDTTPTSTTKTEVLTAASYDWATLVVPINWSFTDEALNQEPERKVDLVSALVDNAIRSHDRAIEAGMFAASATDGFQSLYTLFTEAGTGTVGTIDSSVETWWKNQFKDYDAAAALLADMTTIYNSCSRGTGGESPNVIITGPTEHGVYEGKLVANQRFVDTNTASGGFKVLKFKDVDVVFSNANTVDTYFFLNTKNTKLHVVKGAFRQRRTPIEHVNATMMNMKTFSVLQIATNNRSRNGVLFT